MQRCSRLECEARAERGCVRGVGGKRRRSRRKKKCLFMGCGPVQGGDGVPWMELVQVCFLPFRLWFSRTDVKFSIAGHHMGAPLYHSDERRRPGLKDKLLFREISINSPSASHCELRVGPAGGGPLVEKGRRKRIEHVGGRPGRVGAAIDRASRQGGEREGRRAREYEGSSSGVDPAPGGAARRMRAVLPPRTRPEGGHREGEEEPRVLGQAKPAVEGPGRRA